MHSKEHVGLVVSASDSGYGGREWIPTGGWLISLHDEQGTLTLESTG